MFNVMKILIVEDNLQVRRMICRFVREFSDEIREENDGVNALSAYRDFQPDWVLMDIQMKQMNGIEASKEIIAEYPKAKIVIVTSHNSPALREKAKEAGISGFILKENLSDLREILV